MAALSELILQMVTYLYTGSHIKPRRVKTHMQMKAGRKGHKKNERGSAMMSFFCFAFATVFCFGQELIRGETEFSFNYWIWKGSFWPLRDTTTTLFGTSYFDIFYSPSQMDKFDLSSIPKFDGSPTGPSIVEWFEKANYLELKNCRWWSHYDSRKEAMRYTSNLEMMQTWRKLSVPCIWLLGQTSSLHGNSLSDNGSNPVRQ